MPTDHIPDGDAFLSAAMERVASLAASQRDAIRDGARLVADCVAAGGVVQAFGTGHSAALAMEIAGRAGGLVPTNPLSLRDGVLYGGEDAAGIDPLAERDPAVAHRIYRLARSRVGDLFVIASNSGVNGCVVELARLVKRNGHQLIAVISREHAERVASRHPSGGKLPDHADVVIDNRAPYGDAVLALPGGAAMCGVSSVTSAVAAQMLTADAVALLAAAGLRPPIYRSANIPDGDAHNRRLESAYPGRIRRGDRWMCPAPPEDQVAE